MTAPALQDSRRRRVHSALRQRPRLVWLAAALLLVLAVFLIWRLVVLRTDRSWQRLQGGGALRVAVDPSFPPFENTDADGRITGFDADLALELGRRLNVPVEFKAIAFDGLVDAVIAGKVDVVVSAFPLDPRLSQDVRFSLPYFDAGLVVVAPAPPDSPRSPAADSPEAALAGQKVAVEWGSQGDAWARERNLPTLRMETPQDALSAAATGTADAAIVDAVTAALALPDGLVVLQPALTSDPYVIVMPHGAAKLGAAIDDALTAMVADGAWARLVADYFPSPPPPPLSPISAPILTPQD